MRVLSHICNFVAENSWSYDNVNKAETILALKEIEPEFVVDQIFNFYFSVQSNDPSREKYHVHRDRLSRFFGEYLLQTGTSFDLSEFVSMWGQSMPEAENDDEGFSADLKYLKGIALVYFYHHKIMLEQYNFIMLLQPRLKNPRLSLQLDLFLNINFPIQFKRDWTIFFGFEKSGRWMRLHPMSNVLLHQF